MLGQEGLSAAATGTGTGDAKDRTNLDNWRVFHTSVRLNTRCTTLGKESSVLCGLHFPSSEVVPACNCVLSALSGGQSEPLHFCRLLFQGSSLKCHPFPIPSIILGIMTVSCMARCPTLDIHCRFEHCFCCCC